MGKHRSNVKLKTEAICNKLSCIARNEHWMEGVDEGTLTQLGGRMGRHQNGLGKGEKWEKD